MQESPAEQTSGAPSRTPSDGAEKTSPICANCYMDISVLRRCAKCKSVAYCNRECQKSHWKIHKKICHILANRVAAKTTSSSAEGAGSNPDIKPFTAISNNTFLHNRSEEETFRILIDVIRMRQEDTHVFDGNAMPGTVYDGQDNSALALRLFLDKSAQLSGFLPPWWNQEKTEECVQFGLYHSECLLGHAQGKSDIQASWNDDQMPMKLRALGEIVYGNTPGTSRGSGNMVLDLMSVAEDENSGWVTSTMDMTRLAARRWRDSV